MMDKQLQGLLLENLFTEGYRNDSTIENLVEKRGFNRNMILAHNIELIDDGLKGKINDVRKTRNKLLHETDERLNIHRWRGQIDKINKAADTPKELYELCRDEST